MHVAAPRPVEWIWRHIAIRLPADWEMLQFSTEFNRGRCAFADRYQFRAEMSWRIVGGEPDYGRMVSDYMHKLEQDKKLTGAAPAKKSGWHGFFGIVQGEATSRFGRYLPEIGCLVEVVFLWPEEKRNELEAEVLASIAAKPPAEGRQPWRAFGMDMRPPASAAFAGCIAQPARAAFTFTNPKTGNQWEFERLGMVSSWFGGDLERWLQHHLGHHTKDLRFTHRQRQNTDTIIAEGAFKPQGLHLRPGRVEALAWICPQDGRLYAAKKWQRRPAPNDDISLDQALQPAPEFTPASNMH